jgi:hypothetical protein
LLFWSIDRWRWRWELTSALVFGSDAVLGFALANMLNPLEACFIFTTQTVASRPFEASFFRDLRTGPILTTPP